MRVAIQKQDKQLLVSGLNLHALFEGNTINQGKLEATVKKFCKITDDVAMKTETELADLHNKFKVAYKNEDPHFGVVSQVAINTLFR